MRIVLLLLLTAVAWAQTNINVQPGALSAILDFDSPSAGDDCTVDVTYRQSAPGTPNWSNLLPWSDRTLYPSLSVAPKGSIHRRKVIGEWNLRVGVNQASTDHMMLPVARKIYLRITCGVQSPIISEFRTLTYPFGFTYQHRTFVDVNIPGGVHLPS